LLIIGLALLLSACANQQIRTKTQQNIPTTLMLTIDLQLADLRRGAPLLRLRRSQGRKKTSTIRLFLQIWDSHDGSVAWEGAQESTLSHESLAEEYVSMKSIVQKSARDLVAHLP
jgi:hypothetical protein